jgi:Rrf2 family protein
MKINQTVRYGVACLYELSKHVGDYLDAHQLAALQNIPPAYAQKVLQGLARAGLVFAQKGVGYKIVRPLIDITALDVIEALTNEADAGATSPDLGNVLEMKINKALGTVSLGDLITK